MSNEGVVAQESKDVYLMGIDPGSASAGWAVSDSDYNILRMRGQRAWGVRSFEKANVAKGRRSFRSTRRRYDRRRERLGYLNEIFMDQISKIDPDFFDRLRDSFFTAQDKRGKNKGSRATLFNDANFKDADFHRLYPTPWHLRSAILNKDSDTPTLDIRLYFLSIHGIVKNRGHFHYAGKIEVGDTFDRAWESFIIAADSLGLAIMDDPEALLKLLKLTNITKRDLKSQLVLELKSEDKATSDDPELKKRIAVKTEAYLHLIAGSDVQKAKLFDGVSEDDKGTISLSKDFEELETDLQSVPSDSEFDAVRSAKGLYDFRVLYGIVGEEKYLSFAFCKLYEKHRSDREELRSVLEELNPLHKQIVKAFFEGSGNVRGKSELWLNFKASLAKGELVYVEGGRAANKTVMPTYLSYVKGVRVRSGKKEWRCKHTQSDFLGALKEYLKAKIKETEKNPELISPELLAKIKKIKLEAEDGKFLPVQRGNFGGVIPMQLHHNELKIIVEKLLVDYPEMDVVDADGHSTTDKLLSLHKFKIPYYVGPLNPHSEFSWLKDARKPGKIYPWNWEEKIDKAKAARCFINELTASCTYLPDQGVLPRQSLIYQKFAVLNVLNKMTTDQMPLPTVELKQKIFEEVFEQRNAENWKNVTIKSLREGLSRIDSAYRGKAVSLGDADQEGKRGIPDQCSTFGALKKIGLSADFIENNLEVLEEIILAVASLPEDRKILEDEVKSILSGKGIQLEKSVVESLAKLRLPGWGKLSKELLTNVVVDHKYFPEVPNDEVVSILNVLWYTNLNFMQIVSHQAFVKAISGRRKEQFKDVDWNEYLAVSYASAPVIRTVTQAFRVFKEITRIKGCPPKRVFIESTKGGGEKGRTESRYNKLVTLYNNLEMRDKERIKPLKEQLANYRINDDKFSHNLLFLYFTQLGKCAYCERPLDIEKGKSGLTKDHIIPQSMVKDDSIDNLVVAHSNCNKNKGDEYPIPDSFRRPMLYGQWRKQKLISKSKYDRLMRPVSRDLTRDELAQFVARQLVETSQATKLLRDLIEIYYPGVEVHLVPATLISQLRRASAKNYDEVVRGEFVKIRDLNDYHHAKDAYLAIVAGNVTLEKFTKDPKRWFQRKDDGELDPKAKKFHMANFFDQNHVNQNGEVIWNGEIYATVARHMARNDILVTHMTEFGKGAFYNQQIVPGSVGGVVKKDSRIPVKLSDERLKNTAQYGGYLSLKTSHLVWFEKSGGERRLESVPLLYANITSVYLNKRHAVKVRIIRDRIPLYSKVLINGFPCYVTGGDQGRINLQSARQFILTDADFKSGGTDFRTTHAYLRRIINTVGKISSIPQKTSQKQAIVESIIKSSKITEQRNKDILRIIKMEQRNKDILRIIKSDACSDERSTELRPFQLEADIEFLEQSTLMEQIETIYNLVIKIFSYEEESVKLSAFGIKGVSGRIRRVISSETVDSLVLLDESPTGLYQERIVLLNSQVAGA